MQKRDLNTTAKGNRLEDQFYAYLLDQQLNGEPLLGTHTAAQCKILRKPRVYCHVRKRQIEFDLILEVYRTDAKDPHLRIIFECKNKSESVKEREITDFSSKLSRLFKHGSKGFIVTSSRLQSGAANLARNCHMGIIKYDVNGIEFVAERRGGPALNKEFLKDQLEDTKATRKPLRFSAIYDGRYFSSFETLIGGLEPTILGNGFVEHTAKQKNAPFLSESFIEGAANTVLQMIDYRSGSPNLSKICFVLGINLRTNQQHLDNKSNHIVLGIADFDARSIFLNHHENKQRERFTLAHEIGHFYLRHDRFLKSETMLESDLFIANQSAVQTGYERLEFQANVFASHLLLQTGHFSRIVAQLRHRLGIGDRGFGYIYVDNQRCNYELYNELVARLSTHFEVSKQAIEVKLTKLGMLRDDRKRVIAGKTVAEALVTGF